MGITKRDAPISWRPSKDAALALAKLLEGGRKRGEILNELVIAAGEVTKEPGAAGSLPSVVRRQAIQKPGWKK